MSLTETQTFLLSAASRRDDLLIPLPDTLKGGAADKVARGLITKGFAEECVVSRHAGSKQGQLIAMLSKEEGASVSEIATALGWLPHTTRAALTGLRHKGYELAREINGDRGSIYRIIAMPIISATVTDTVQAEAA